MNPPRNGSGEAGIAELHSFVDRTYHAVLSRGRFGGLFQAYLEHASAVGAVPEPGALAMMRKALVGSTLQLALLPPDQFCSWTFNVVSPPLNLFVAGDNGAYQVTGRVFSEGVRTEAASRLFYESQRPRHRPARSVVEFEGFDVFEAFRGLYERGLQVRARLFDLGDEEHVLVQGLPMVDEPWLGALDEAGAAARTEEGAPGVEPIETRSYRFRCGCDATRMARVMKDMFASDPDELFGGDAEVEVQCPRCGRSWIVTRASFEAGDLEA